LLLGHLSAIAEQDNKLNETQSDNKIQKYCSNSKSNVPLLLVELMQSIELIQDPNREHGVSGKIRHRKCRTVRRRQLVLLPT